MKIPTMVAGLCALSSASIASAEVIDAAANGFNIRHEATVAANRDDVYRILVQHVSEWWDSDHSITGNADNLWLDDSLDGCFCETIGDNGELVHLQVTFVNPGVMLRLTGGLGPLGLMGVNGNLVWEFEPLDAATTVKLSYAVGGYLHGGLDTIAPAVDRVLGEQLERLKARIETGDNQNARE